MLKEEIKYNKPIYLGSSILDISKNLMYDFHYNYIKAKYNDKAKLLFTDSDSLCYQIETEDFLKNIKCGFHTSNFSKKNKFYSSENKKSIGFMKLETGSNIITEFVGLRAKLYSFRTQQYEEDKIKRKGIILKYYRDTKKCKGISKSVIKKDITLEDYRDTLFKSMPQLIKMKTIKSHLHKVYLQEINKIALSANDDKRIIQKDGISTLAIGHYKTHNT